MVIVGVVYIGAVVILGWGVLGIGSVVIFEVGRYSVNGNIVGRQV